MTHRHAPWLMAIPAVLIAVVFALFTRLPLPFDGFAIAAAAGLALILTLAFGLALPARLLWSDAERLAHAFSQRHEISDAGARVALDAITRAHDRAALLRGASTNFAEPLQARAQALADRLDAAAREIFYDPDTLGVHRKTLVRSELIEDAVSAHATLRGRGESDANSAQMTESRAKVGAALDALEAAFDASEGQVADRLLAQVDVASATAETLLGRSAARN